jgi:hypothetical protein
MGTRSMSQGSTPNNPGRKRRKLNYRFVINSDIHPSYLRFICISFRNGNETLTASQLVDSLKLIPRNRISKSDFIITSGVGLKRFPGRAEMKQIADIPPLISEEIANNLNKWAVLHKGKLNYIRREQYLVHHNDTARRTRHLLTFYDSLSKGEGLFTFRNRPSLVFALLICGENNIFAYDRKKNLLRNYNPNRYDLGAALDRNWICLNPAHREYHPQVSQTGFCKVGARVGSGKRHLPTLSRVIMKDFSRNQNIHPPSAIIHVNNWDHHPESAHKVFLEKSRRFDKSTSPIWSRKTEKYLISEYQIGV